MPGMSSRPARRYSAAPPGWRTVPDQGMHRSEQCQAVPAAWAENVPVGSMRMGATLMLRGTARA
jgi:hypothetical protein